MLTNGMRTNQNQFYKMRRPILSRRVELVVINQKKITCYGMDFAVAANLWLKMRESKTIVVGTLGTLTKRPGERF